MFFSKKICYKIHNKMKIIYQQQKIFGKVQENSAPNIKFSDKTNN